MRHTTTEGYLTGADGVHLHYHTVGEGASSLVVLHGGPGLHMNYLVADLLPLASSRRLIFYDQRGAGQSPIVQDPSALAPEAYVRDLEHVRRYFGLEELTLLGHSWGAAVAVLYALEHPQRLKRLILHDPLPTRATPYLQQFVGNLMGRLSEAERVRLGEVAARWREATDPVAVAREYWSILGPAYFADPAAAARMKGDLSDAPVGTVNPSRVYEATISGLGDWDWRDRIAALAVPTLVIHGASDPIPVEASQEWASILPSAQLVIVDGAGHFPHVEQPETFFRTVEGFLGGIQHPEAPA